MRDLKQQRSDIQRESNEEINDVSNAENKKNVEEDINSTMDSLQPWMRC